MKTNLENVPIGGTVAVTNLDGSITYTTVLGRSTDTLTVDLRLWIPIAVGVIILAVYLYRLGKHKQRT